MPDFHFSISIPVRYSDLDAQGHMNNARYFTFMEEARLKYALALKLWDPEHGFDAVGQIVAEATCAYKAPVTLGQVVRVWVRTASFGHKSMVLEYRLTVDEAEVATGRTVQVAYDYTARAPIPIPVQWRTAIEAFER